MEIKIGGVIMKKVVFESKSDILKLTVKFCVMVWVISVIIFSVAKLVFHTSEPWRMIVCEHFIGTVIAGCVFYLINLHRWSKGQKTRSQ